MTIALSPPAGRIRPGNAPACRTPADASRQPSPPKGIIQLPRELLHAPGHTGWQVWAWATYESLMPRLPDGRRLPARAGRGFLAAKALVSENVIDTARLGLIRTGWLARTAVSGCQRTVRHRVLRAPRDTGGRYAPVPAWTLERVCGRRSHRAAEPRTMACEVCGAEQDHERPPGASAGEWACTRCGNAIAVAADPAPGPPVTADAWRLYAQIVDRADTAGRLRYPVTVDQLGGWQFVGAATGRRRLHCLEAAGLVEVIEQPGARRALAVRAILEAGDADDQAARYAVRGRRTGPMPDPAPANPGESGLTDPGSPQETPGSETPTCGVPDSTSAEVGEGIIDLPTVGDLQDRRRPGRSAVPAGKDHDPPPAAGPPCVAGVTAAAVRLYGALPAELTGRIPEHGSARVLRAIKAELGHRTAGELAGRIARNWAHWRLWRLPLAPVRDATAVAIRLTRRGLRCADLRCEDGTQLDRGQPCHWCRQNPAGPVAGTGGGPGSEDRPERPVMLPPPVGQVLGRRPPAIEDRPAPSSACLQARRDLYLRLGRPPGPRSGQPTDQGDPHEPPVLIGRPERDLR